MSDQYFKLPRIFISQDLKSDSTLSLDDAQAHYFKSVIRRKEGDNFRAFNGKDGEWLISIEELGKKNGRARIIEKIRPQPDDIPPVHLLFAPIKKQRLDLLIEKAVELGATDLHPVLTAHTENRKINETRMAAQIKEASEQCERMQLSKLHPIESLNAKINNWALDIKIKACLERERDKGLRIKDVKPGNHAFLVGPEGGFNDQETEFLLSNNKITPISLGEVVYRAETASMICLASANNFS